MKRFAIEQLKQWKDKKDTYYQRGKTGWKNMAYEGVWKNMF